MDSTPVTGKKRQTSRSSRAPAKIHCLGDDILCLIFSFVDHLDLVRCSVVCKSWNEIVYKSKLLQSSYFKMMQLGLSLEELAIERHGSALREGDIEVNQWSGHSIGMNQCRMRMGMLLTGVGDKVMRLWSLESYKCVEEYSIPYNTPLVDFGFDENKIVGLIGTRICIWKRNGRRSIFPSREGTFPKGLCMRYFDPEAVVGCEDGTAHVFDMYSRKCSEIIRMHLAPVRCICLSDDQLIISGSTLGAIAISGLSSNQPVANLRSTDRTDIRDGHRKTTMAGLLISNPTSLALSLSLFTHKPLLLRPAAASLSPKPPRFPISPAVRFPGAGDRLRRRERGLSLVTRAGPTTSSYIFAFVLPFSLIILTVFTSIRIADKLDRDFLEEVALNEAMREGGGEDESEYDLSLEQNATPRTRNRPKREV